MRAQTQEEQAPRAVTMFLENLEAMRAELVEASDAYSRAFAIAKTIDAGWTRELETELIRYQFEIGQRLSELAKATDKTPTDNTIEQWVEEVDDLSNMVEIAWQPTRSLHSGRVDG